MAPETRVGLTIFCCI